MYSRVPGEGKDWAMRYDVDTLTLARAQSVSDLDSAGVLILDQVHLASPMSGPVPSNLVLLSDLGQCAPGMKVRFLGW